ncbi:MAG: hypothetical protein HETSPECPRED_008183 [Heterodermia speciosa]|uniref:Uncharacterized protein n=1 Tax=Heterodermia speciosa TaxID=116794 RepID=A0A8H3FZA8_9LECA|nr:MAG: hypothetical protein HETSPECPRED_008183 [Heterodermia speciosa]
MDDPEQESIGSPSATTKKASKRSNSPSSHRKPCDLCYKMCDVLVRCRIDETLIWHLVCTSKCWKQVSGGEIDGGPGKSYYQYGGMWKNKLAGVSAKKPKQKKNSLIREWNKYGIRYVMNDKVKHAGTIWVCRRSHKSSETTIPDLGCTYWKEYEKVPDEPSDAENLHVDT